MRPFARIYRRLRREYDSIAAGEPGRRFIEHYARQRRGENRHQSAGKNVAYVLLGVLLLIGGLLLSLPPGVPGFVLWIPGLGLLVGRLRRFALLLDRVELHLRALCSRVRRAWRKLTTA